MEFLCIKPWKCAREKEHGGVQRLLRIAEDLEGSTQHLCRTSEDDTNHPPKIILFLGREPEQAVNKEDNSERNLRSSTKFKTIHGSNNLIRSELISTNPCSTSLRALGIAIHTEQWMHASDQALTNTFPILHRMRIPWYSTVEVEPTAPRVVKETRPPRRACRHG